MWVENSDVGDLSLSAAAKKNRPLSAVEEWLKSPPAAFNPLHNFAAFSPQRDRQSPDSRCPRRRDRRGVSSLGGR